MTKIKTTKSPNPGWIRQSHDTQLEMPVDETTCIMPAYSLQLATSLLTTCNRLGIIKPEQAMRMHPDIGLVIGDLLQLARFWLCR